MKTIPWLVQGSTPDTRKLSATWETVQAETSEAAAIAWAQSVGLARLPLPFQVHVGPVAGSLRHENGMPKVCRTFTFQEKTA